MVAVSLGLLKIKSNKMKPLTAFYIFLLLAVALLMGGIIFDIMVAAIKIVVGVALMTFLYVIYKLTRP
jgi:hypothetical protein